MNKVVFIFIALLGLVTVSQAQVLSGKKSLKTAKKLVVSGNDREALDVLTRNKDNAGKYSDELTLQMGILQGKVLLIDSAIISLTTASNSTDLEIQESAKIEFEKAEKQKEKYDFNVALAKAYVRQKDWVTAQMSLTETLKYDTGNYEAWLAMGDIAESTKSVQESLDLFIKASTKYVPGNPELAHVYEHIAETYLVMRAFPKAVEAVNTAIELDSLTTDAYFIKAKALFNQNDYENAEKSISIYVKYDTQNKAAWNLRGDCFFYLKRYASAIPNYSEAIHLDEKMTESHNFRARSYYYTKQYVLAESDFEYLNQIFEENYYAINGLGLCAYAQEDYPKAIGYFEQVITITNQENYKFNLAMAYYKNKQLKLSLQYFDELAVNNRFEPKYNVAKVWVLMELNEYKKAEEWINVSIKNNPYLKEYYAVRGKIYRELKEDKKAAKDERIAHAIEGSPLTFDLNF